MKNSAVSGIMLTLLLASMLTLAFDVGLVRAEEAVVSVYPQTSVVKFCETFAIDIVVTDVVGVMAFEIRLDYDTTILDCKDGVEGPFLKKAGGTMSGIGIDDSRGRVTVWAMAWGTASGSGVLFTIFFKATAVGESELNMGLWNSGGGEPHSWLIDAAIKLIPHESVNGLVQVVPTETGFLDISTNIAPLGDILVDGFLEGTGSAYVQLPLGSYAVSFGDVADYVTPGGETVALTYDGEVKTVVGVYEEIPTGFLDISTTPVNGEIFVDEVWVGTGSAYVERELGTYTVSFGDVAGYMTPDPQTATLTTDNEVITVVGTYVLPHVRIQELIETIESWNLAKGTENSLTSKLEEAFHLLTKSAAWWVSNPWSAKQKLLDFINQVEALRSKGKLEDWQADYLVAEVQEIVGVIW